MNDIATTIGIIQSKVDQLVDLRNTNILKLNRIERGIANHDISELRKLKSRWNGRVKRAKRRLKIGGDVEGT